MAGVVAGVGMCAWLASPEPEAKAVPLATVRIAGQTVETTADFGPDLVRLTRSYLGAYVSLSLEEECVRASRAAVGAAVDVEHLRALLRDAADPGSLMNRVRLQAQGSQPLRLPMPVVLDQDLALRFILELKDKTDSLPLTGRIDLQTGAAVPGRPGRELHMGRTLIRLEQGLRQGLTEIEAVATRQAPRAPVAESAAVELSTMLARFGTRQSHAQAAEFQERAYALHVAAARIHGLVISEGEVFDFNRAFADRGLGPRRVPLAAAAACQTKACRRAVFRDTACQGPAAEAECQLASTLHAAALFAGLPILERTPQPRPPFYIKLGLDAAVAHGQDNLRIRNDRSFPIAIDARSRGQEVTVALHGKKQDRDVTFIRRIEQAFPFHERLEEDERLPRGLQLLVQRGIPGFAVTRVRKVRNLHTGQVRETTDKHRYPPTTQVWRIGTGPATEAGFVVPEGDPLPEYVADHFLQAARLGARTSIEVTAKSGTYGHYGWTIRQGMNLGALATVRDDP